MMLDDQYSSSVDSLDLHKQNKATILKKAGSTRRNLPQLNFKDKYITVQKILAATNDDLADIDGHEDDSFKHQNFPVIEKAIDNDPHYQSQMMFASGLNPHISSFYTERQGPQKNLRQNINQNHIMQADNSQHGSLADRLQHQLQQRNLTKNKNATTARDVGPFIQIESSNLVSPKEELLHNVTQSQMINIQDDMKPLASRNDRFNLGSDNQTEIKTHDVS